MPERVHPNRCLVAGVALLLLLLPAAGAAAAGERDEPDLYRGLRIAMLDGELHEVLELAGRYLKAYPEGENVLRVRFYRAVALAEVSERRGEAIDAFQEIIPDVDDPILLEDAWIRLLRLAGDDAAAGSERGRRILAAALAQSDPSVVAIAGIRVAALEGPDSLREKALQRLVEIHTRLGDDLADEVVLAILKIDPSRAPATARRTTGPRMIHLRVENGCVGEVPVVQVAVNLPASFAKAVLDALGEGLREEVMRGLAEEGIDLQGLVGSLEELDETSALEFRADDCITARIWID